MKKAHSVQSVQSCHGGAFLSSFKLPNICGEDVLTLIDRLCELGYSLDSVIEILNKPREKSDHMIL